MPFQNSTLASTSSSARRGNVEDAMIRAINSGAINERNISAQRLRKEFRDGSLGLHYTLDYGHAILETVNHLDQYLHSYGNMIVDQWQSFLIGEDLPEGPVQIIDYACGQGLGTALLLDHYGNELRRRVQTINLIEPSTVALRRAMSVAGSYCPHALLNPINQELDQIDTSSLANSYGLTTIHVMSNILDVNGFDHIEMIERIANTEGEHIILAVSSDRDCVGGSSRFEDCNRRISELEDELGFSECDQNLYHFDIPNRSNPNAPRPVIGWRCDLSVA